jgi:hypothetical protein
MRRETNNSSAMPVLISSRHLLLESLIACVDVTLFLSVLNLQQSLSIMNTNLKSGSVNAISGIYVEDEGKN